MGHAAKICEQVLREKPNILLTSPSYGCFVDDGRTCPTATRLEGLIAALSYLPEENLPLRHSMRSAIDSGIAFLLRSQVKEGPCAGGIPRKLTAAGKQDPGRRDGEIRIDYVQHALSAMIAYEALIRKTP
jgi:hypothetical protein